MDYNIVYRGRMKTIPSALCVNKRTKIQEILSIDELIKRDRSDVNLNDIFDFFCNSCAKRTKLSYNSYKQRERSYLSTYPGVEHDDECGIEKIYTSTSKTKDVLTNKPSSIKSKILDKFSPKKQVLKKSDTEDITGKKKQKEANVSNAKNKKYKNYFSVREKKIEKISTEYFEENIGNYILLYGKVNVYKKVYLQNNKLILKCVSNNVFFDIFISSKIQKHIDLTNIDKVTKLGFCALLSKYENKGYKNWNFNLEHSDHMQIIK